jgi:hypothetical protein
MHGEKLPDVELDEKQTPGIIAFDVKVLWNIVKKLHINGDIPENMLKIFYDALAITDMPMTQANIEQKLNNISYLRVAFFIPIN